MTRQMTVSQSVYIVVKKYILIIKDLIKNSCALLCFLCNWTENIRIYFSFSSMYSVTSVEIPELCSHTAHMQFFKH